MFAEALTGWHPLPQVSAMHEESLLARHAVDIFTRCAAQLKSFKDGSADRRFNAQILPQAELAITSLGQALAHSAACKAKVAQPLLDLFECAMINFDRAWYVENAGLTDRSFRQMEDRAATAALPLLKSYIDAFNIRPWISTTPIHLHGNVHGGRWPAQLPIYGTVAGLEDDKTSSVKTCH